MVLTDIEYLLSYLEAHHVPTIKKKAAYLPDLSWFSRTLYVRLKGRHHQKQHYFTRRSRI